MGGRSPVEDRPSRSYAAPLQAAIARIFPELGRPVIIDNRAINGTPASRFTHWAAPVYDYVKIHYVRVAEIKSTDTSIEVFAKSFDPIS